MGGLGIGEEVDEAQVAEELPPDLPERQNSRASTSSRQMKQTETVEVPIAVLDLLAETWCKYRQLQGTPPPEEAKKEVPLQSYKEVKQRRQMEPEPETTPIEERAGSDSDPDSLMSTNASLLSSFGFSGYSSSPVPSSGYASSPAPSSRGSLVLPGVKSTTLSQSESISEPKWMLRPRDMSPVHQRSPVQILRKDARD